MRSLKTELVEKGFSQPRTAEMEIKGVGIGRKQKERLSDREWAELMGVNRQTHKRVGGRVRKR